MGLGKISSPLSPNLYMKMLMMKLLSQSKFILNIKNSSVKLLATWVEFFWDIWLDTENIDHIYKIFKVDLRGKMEQNMNNKILLMVSKLVMFSLIFRNIIQTN
jgi:hypothetical protein